MERKKIKSIIFLLFLSNTFTVLEFISIPLFCFIIRLSLVWMKLVS